MLKNMLAAGPAKKFQSRQHLLIYITTSLDLYKQEQ